MSKSIIPLADRVLIAALEVNKPAERKVGDIIIPEGIRTPGTNDAYTMTEVLEVGPECKAVKTWDKVMVARNQTWVVKVGDTEATFVREREIIAIVREEPSAV